MLALAMMAPSALYTVSQQAAYTDWPRRIIWLPVLVAIGVGIAISNSRAVLEALIRRESAFIRTPKRGDRLIKHYTVKCPWTAVMEICLGVYCTVSLGVYLSAGKYLIGPFLGIYVTGFLYVGVMTVAHSRKLLKTGRQSVGEP